MMERRGSSWGRAIAVLAVVALGAMTVAPAFGVHNNRHTRKTIRKITKKKINNIVPGLVDQGIGEVINLFGNSFVRVTATSGPDEATARTNAPQVPLLSKGQLSVYGKCFEHTGTVRGEVFIATTSPGAIFASRDGDDKDGGDSATDFLNPDTLETDRLILDDSTTSTEYSPDDSEDWHAMAPDGTNLEGMVSVAIKEGELTEGNGVYGPGNVCLFGGFAAG